MSFELNIFTWELQIFHMCKQELSAAVVLEEINVLLFLNGLYKTTHYYCPVFFLYIYIF